MATGKIYLNISIAIIWIKLYWEIKSFFYWKITICIYKCDTLNSFLKRQHIVLWKLKAAWVAYTVKSLNERMSSLDIGRWRLQWNMVIIKCTHSDTWKKTVAVVRAQYSLLWAWAAVESQYPQFFQKSRRSCSIIVC